MPLGSLAEQFSTRIAESSSVVAGNFPWLMTASSLSLLWGCCVLGFFLCVCVCFGGCVWVGYFCLCFCSMSSFFCLPCLTSQFLEVAPTDCVGDPGSRASSARLKDLNSVFLCPNHLATGQAGLILYPPPALPLGRNSILFSVKVYSSCCSSGEQIRSDELALSHGKAILFKKFLSKPESACWASSQSSG